MEQQIPLEFKEIKAFKIWLWVNFAGIIILLYCDQIVFVCLFGFLGFRLHLSMKSTLQLKLLLLFFVLLLTAD